MAKEIFVTTSLPYANGPLHLGHLLENVQADIWVRFQRCLGNKCVFVSGSDAHGSAIMLSAEKQGISADEWVEFISSQHRADLFDFGISFDIMQSTRSAANASMVEHMYQRLQHAGCFANRPIQQLYDASKSMFLPDRFVKGACPRCGAPDQYGDNCEVCGATYAATELLEPYSVLSKTVPELRQSEHVFFLLSQCQHPLMQWLTTAQLQEPVRNKLREWFEFGLKDWDVSRDAPYFGFLIPGYKDKYFYVWLDAPIGYLSGLQTYSQQQGDDLFTKIFVEPESLWEIHHFIGKDIMYFHGLFWPAMLQAAGYRPPTSLHAHGFLSIEGSKMSKSRGSFITIRDYLQQLSPEYIRYYFASKLADSVADLDFSWQDCAQRCNAELIGKIINVGSRSCCFINKYFKGQLSSSVHDERLWQKFVQAKTTICAHYEAKRFSQVVREVTGLADLANRYIDQHKPWQAVKEHGASAEVHAVVSMGMHLFRLMILYLQPILPDTADKVAHIFQQENLDWAVSDTPLVDAQLTAFPRLLERLDVQKNPFA